MEPKRPVNTTMHESGKTAKRLKTEDSQVIPKEDAAASQTRNDALPDATRPPGRSVARHDYTSIRLEQDQEPTLTGAHGSCSIPGGGGCLIPDRYNKRLKRLDMQFRVTGSLDMPCWPWSVCCDGNEAAVSLPDSQVIVVVSLQSPMEIVREIKASCECIAVAHHQGKLVCVGLNKSKSMLFCRFDWHSGKKEKHTLVRDRGEVMKDQVYQMAVSDDGDRVYVAAGCTGLLVLDKNGKVEKILKYLYGTYGVCLDAKECVYVCGKWRDKKGDYVVKQCSRDGQVSKIIINTDQLRQSEPTSVCYVREGEILVVTFVNDSGEIGIFYLM